MKRVSTKVGVYLVKKIVAVILFICIFVNTNAIPTSATTDVVASEYGFVIDDTYYSTTWYSSQNVMNIWLGGILVGQAFQQVGVARKRTNLKNQTVLVRFMMCPEDTYLGNGSWIHGINKLGKISMTLSEQQTYNNNAPDSSIVTYNDSCSFSLGGSVNSKGEFSGNFGIGATTSWSNNCFDIISKVTNGRKTITTSYNYTPTANIFSTQGRKKVNKWLNGSHKEYAMIQYNNSSTSIPDFSISYTATMWYAISSSSTWNGSTWDVWQVECKNSTLIKYI